LFGVMLGSAAEGFYGEPSFNPVLLVLAILFGWIPSVISLIAMRLGLEFSVATVRTAQNTKRIAEVAEHGRCPAAAASAPPVQLRLRGADLLTHASELVSSLVGGANRVTSTAAGPRPPVLA